MPIITTQCFAAQACSGMAEHQLPQRVLT
jgi:hypothetical protein